MSVAFVPRAAGAQRAGFLAVVGLHVLIGLALLYGLASTMISAVPPPLVVTKPLAPDDKPPPEPPTDLPKPDKPVLSQSWVPVPDDPIMQQQQQQATITTSREPAADPVVPMGHPSGTGPQASPEPIVQRAATRPVIFNLQACAPTGDDYPANARRAEAAGTTRLRFSVNAAGALVASEVLRSAGPTREHKLLDRVAQTKLAGCSFGAGIDENGRPVGGTFDVDYVWKIEN